MKLLLTIILFIGLKLFEIFIRPVYRTLKWCISDSNFGPVLDKLRFNILKIIAILILITIVVLVYLLWNMFWIALMYKIFTTYGFIYIFSMLVDTHKDTLPEPSWIPAAGALIGAFLPLIVLVIILYAKSIYRSIRCWLANNWLLAKDKATKILK